MNSDPNSHTTFLIRSATVDDVAIIHRLVYELAVYEKLEHLVVSTPETFKHSLFGPNPSAEAVLAFEGEAAVGFAMFFHNFSTFLGIKGLWLEDIFVLPSKRGKGYGKALLLHVARIAKERKCGRFEWAALDWNTPAWDFYKSLGAVPMDDWTMFRVTGTALDKMASMQ